jgi:hypothetical protein
MSDKMEPQPFKNKLGAEIMMVMLDLVKAAPPGASVVCGGAFMKKDDGWTPKVIADKQNMLQQIIDAPDLPDNIWHDRIPKNNGVAL